MHTTPMERLNTALVGCYTLERKLGEGGMATVFLAADLKHGRKVALKVLKPELAAVVGAERFLSEIKTTANLQHPHILPLFDSGEAEGFLYYVMPYVEGESLRERLERERQLPVDEAVRLATAVAQALQHAHERGVIHRDIKPANILLQDGQPVVADFGIALAVGAAGGGRLTETGLSVGTPYYMSPEQATGDRTVGPASDVYSLACVLYEVLVGDPPFSGSSAQAVLGRIISGAPVAPTEHRPSVPAHVDAAVRRALEKVPADRFTSAEAFAKALGDRAFRHGEAQASAVGAAGTWNRITSAFAGIAIVAVGLAAWGWLRPDPAGPVTRIRLLQPEDQALQERGGTGIALSPDGSLMAYIGPADFGTQIWMKAADQLDARPIPGTQGAWQLFFSPDGERLGFTTEDNTLKSISLGAEAPVTLVDFIGRAGGAWDRDGNLYGMLENYGISRFPVAGGPPETLTAPDTARGESEHLSPVMLPGGAGVLFTIRHQSLDPEAQEIAVADLETGAYTVLFNGVYAVYAPTGHIVFVRPDGTLSAAPFDEGRLEVTGPATPLWAGVAVDGGSVDLAISTAGTLVYRTGVPSRVSSEAVWVTRDGVASPIDTTWPGRDARGPKLSPDGSRLALSIYDPGPNHIWVKELSGGQILKLTFAGLENWEPVWTADGQSVTFVSDRDGATSIFTKPADGSGPAELTLRPDRLVQEAHWSPDGEWLVYRTSFLDPDGSDIFAIRLGEDTEPVSIAGTEFEETSPALSPDGRWLAYASDESGSSQIYVVAFPDAADVKWAVSTGGGAGPIWTRGGRELVYRSLAGDMVAVEVRTTPTFAPGQERVLFSYAPFVNVYGGAPAPYDATEDGERFVMIRNVVSAAGELVMVQNFFEELQARLGG